MLRSPKKTVLFVNTVTEAWSTMCPEETFYGLTLEQYKEEVKPVFDVRAEAAEIDRRWIGVMAQREDVDDAATRLSRNIVRAVRAHPKHGEDSPVYAAMGYTRESARATGRRRTRRAEVKPEPQEAVPVAEKS